MSRLAAFIFLLCAGCASANSDAMDLWFGDVNAMMSPGSSVTQTDQHYVVGPGGNAPAAPQAGAAQQK